MINSKTQFTLVLGVSLADQTCILFKINPEKAREEFRSATQTSVVQGLKI
jgi:hypothetical protein